MKNTSQMKKNQRKAHTLIHKFLSTSWVRRANPISSTSHHIHLITPCTPPVQSSSSHPIPSIRVLIIWILRFLWRRRDTVRKAPQRPSRRRRRKYINRRQDHIPLLLSIFMSCAAIVPINCECLSVYRSVGLVWMNESRRQVPRAFCHLRAARTVATMLKTSSSSSTSAAPEGNLRGMREWRLRRIPLVLFIELIIFFYK